ncbi:MAG TPA: agmatine deiminase family protein [Candidatus Thermoplasmatota archaeon]|nr:agmatine deiminase family protein [Candidatus Thermoplasmatota archaeon]
MRPSEARKASPPGPTPRELGYAMPAEWAPQETVWLAWPHDPLTFPGRIPQVETIYHQAIRALTRNGRVDLLVSNADERQRVEAWASREGVGNLRLHDVPVADVWIRDYGPTFVRGPRGVAMVDWLFNAWGDKYPTLRPDGVVPRLLAPKLGVPRFEPQVVMEGGSFDVNGEGAVLTTEQCLLHENRNPHLSRERIEGVLRDFLGAETVLWLGEGVVGDDTDGHVDDVARFVAPDTVLACMEEDPHHPNHAILAENGKRLSSMRDPRGRPFKLVPLPMPGDVLDDEGEPLPASYANFLVANGVVLLPVFGHANDERAVRTLEACFPDRAVVPLRCEDMVHGMGTLHCASQQQPAA